ncbi:hypothetical protein SASPL_156192 [Salvia splendens]|uniref:Amino acid transporter transmembrane domain-containing protein n=1 Tax=Salvia splendens TaxID=180675 RepID=A0A8X8VX45_SALSN|nr:hypothetical protein SASPL_156192 [Salvia splendens]
MVEFDDKDKLSDALLRDVESSSSDSHASVKRTVLLEKDWIFRGDRLRSAVIGMECGSVGVDCRPSQYPYPEDGHIRNKSYAEAVGSYLGKKCMWVIGIFLHESYFGFGIAYTITSAVSMRAILLSNCYHKEGHDAPCEYGDSLFILLFGAVQLVFSQIPDFHNMEALSIMAAVMSFAYTFIGLGLGVAKVIGNGQIKGDIHGVTASSAIQKLWLSSQAFGDIAFSFNYNIILLNIQDTLKGPLAENKTMKKASSSAILITSFFFLTCGCFGYAAFGDEAPGNLLTGFGFYEPYWLVDLANVCIVLHLVGGYQVYPISEFPLVGGKEVPDSGFVHMEYTVKLPLVPSFKLNLLRLCFRSVYVAATTGLALLFPYFNQVLGVLGALNFWPLVIYFPVEMYLVQNRVRAWTGIWILLQAFKIFCLLCTIFAFIGSVEGLISNKLK